MARPALRRAAEFGCAEKRVEFVTFAEQVRWWIWRWCDKREDRLLAPSLAAWFDRGLAGRSGFWASCSYFAGSFADLLGAR